MRANRTHLIFVATVVALVSIVVLAVTTAVNDEQALNTVERPATVVPATAVEAAIPLVTSTTTTTVEASVAPPVVVVPLPAPEPVAPHVTAAPAPVPEVSSHGPVERSAVDAIRAHFGAGTLGDQAMAVADCESELDAGAVSDTNDHGLFQINKPSWYHRFSEVTGVAWEDGVYNADLNARFARWLYGEEGWGQWTCARNLGFA